MDEERHAIFQAVVAGDSQAASALSRLGLINQQDSKVLPIQLGATPLMHAVLRSNEALVGQLLDSGADPNLANSLGDSPLHVAADHGYCRTAQLLLNSGADPNLRNAAGETSLHLAVMRGNATLTSLLLSRGADPDLADSSMERTALHYAVEASLVECSVALLHYNATMEVPDYAGDTAWSLATESMQRILQEYKSVETVVFEGTSSSEELDSAEELSEDSLRECADSKQLPNATTGIPTLNTCNPRSTFQHGYLKQFLTDSNLSEYLSCLVEAGFDDVQAMVCQMNSPVPITLDMLQSIGFKKLGHAKRLLMRLSPGVADTPTCCNASRTPSETVSLETWLGSLNLEHLAPQFDAAGYECPTLFRTHMHSQFPITDAVLQEEVGITKLGHRLRILGKLQTEVCCQCKAPTCQNCQSF